jgi:hypothetical protein
MMLKENEGKAFKNLTIPQEHQRNLMKNIENSRKDYPYCFFLIKKYMYFPLILLFPVKLI